jgi:hypothetical protein
VQGVASNDGDGDDDNDPGMIAARGTVASLLAEGAIDRLCEALVGKFLRLYPDEVEEWENDPEGQYETDLPKRTPLEANLAADAASSRDGSRDASFAGAHAARGARGVVA